MGWKGSGKNQWDAEVRDDLMSDLEYLDLILFIWYFEFRIESSLMPDVQMTLPGGWRLLS